VLCSALSDDAGGLVFVEEGGAECVLRDSTSGGRSCTALAYLPPGGDAVYLTDFTLEDLYA